MGVGNLSLLCVITRTSRHMGQTNPCYDVHRWFVFFLANIIEIKEWINFQTDDLP